MKASVFQFKQPHSMLEIYVVLDIGAQSLCDQLTSNVGYVLKQKFPEKLRWKIRVKNWAKQVEKTYKIAPIWSPI